MQTKWERNARSNKTLKPLTIWTASRAYAINDNDNDNDNKFDIIKKEEKKESKEEKIQNFVKYWNSCIDSTESRMKKIKAITPERKAKIEIIMKTFPAESAAQAIANAMRSPYCNGETQRRLKPVDFDWLMRLDNFTKALEGAL